MKLLAIIPAFNEAPSLEAVVRGVADQASSLELEYCVLICDDGSTDDTSEVLRNLAQRFSIHVITHIRNRGLGETIRDLVERACELAESGDVIVRLDGDGTHPTAIIAMMLAEIKLGADLVIASRFQDGGGQVGLHGRRLWFSRSANILMRLVFPIRGVREYSCGYRMYRAETLMSALAVYGSQFIQLKDLGFVCTLEKLVKLNLLGIQISEVPFVLRYDFKISKSKMVSSITTLGYLVLAVMYHWPRSGWKAQSRRR